MHIGVADALSEELAEAVFTGTQPTGGMCRSFGVFRGPILVAENASWRARLLALSGSLGR